MSHSCRHWIEKFREDFFQRGSSETTWQGDYWKVLKHLPPNAKMTPNLLHSLVISTPVNTRSRRRACMVVGAIARFAGVKYDPSPYAGKYSVHSLTPRDIPTDELITEWVDRIHNPCWKWVLGMLATYGLRPHEIARLDFEQLAAGDPVLWVKPNTKTGERQVWAFHPEWVTDFDLHRVRLPNINISSDRPNSRIGESITHYLREELRLPFPPMALRHRWAIRTLEYGVDVGLAAKQMGHSREVHERIYHRWINASIHQREYDRVLGRVDRPLPPQKPRIEKPPK